MNTLLFHFLLGSTPSKQPRTGSPIPNSVERQLRGLEMGNPVFSSISLYHPSMELIGYCERRCTFRISQEGIHYWRLLSGGHPRCGPFDSHPR
jgi:hypothetical protein